MKHLASHLTCTTTRKQWMSWCWTSPAPLVVVFRPTCYWCFVGNQARYNPSPFSAVERESSWSSKYQPRQEEQTFLRQVCKAVVFETKSPTGNVSPQSAPDRQEASPGNKNNWDKRVCKGLRAFSRPCFKLVLLSILSDLITSGQP